MNEREIAENLIQFALASSVAIGIAAKVPDVDDDAFRSASGALMRISGAPILVTNWHVVDAYRTLAEQRETQFYFSDVAFDPRARLWSEDKDLDLAVIAVHELKILRDRNRAVGIPDICVYEPAVWPPPPPQPGDSVFFAGWPEVGRSVDVAKMEATFQPYSFVGATIAALTDRGFTIEFDRTRLRGVRGDETQEQLQERRLSGLSGAPIYRDMSGVGKPHELVGFVERFSEAWDVLCATSSLHITKNLKLEPWRG